MRTFKQYITEARNKRVDIPYDNKTNAPTRYNNPGGAYPSKDFEKFGIQGYGVIGGGHKIGYYPTVADGVAANIYHLRKMPVIGKTVAQARHYWVYGNFNGTKNLPGMDNNQVITKELLQDHNWLASWMIATARAEGFQGNLDRNVFNTAFRKLDSRSDYDPSQTPEDESKDTKKPIGPELHDYRSPLDAMKGLMQGFEAMGKTMGIGS